MELYRYVRSRSMLPPDEKRVIELAPFEMEPQPPELRKRLLRELEGDDGEGSDLPPRQVIGPDENGIKTVIEYMFNEHGEQVQITTTMQYENLAQAWPSEDFGARLTLGYTDEKLLERPRAPGAKAEETSSKGAYVAGAGSTGTERNEENIVRVTNLSEDTGEPELLGLFRTFGPVNRAYVAINYKTGLSKGFGFVDFVNKEDAERAINKLNGYGYDNLILRVEWATPRAN